MSKRFVTALVSYAVLMAAAAIFLSGVILKGVLILFAGLIAKTAIALKLDR